MATQVAPTYDEFERRYRLLTTQGPKALEEYIQRKSPSQAVTSSDVIHAMDALITKSVNKSYDDYLKTVRRDLESAQTPRGDAYRDKPTQQNQDVPKAPGSRANPSWMKNLEHAAQVIADAVNQPQNPELITSYDNAVNDLKNQLKAEHKLRMAAKMRMPAPSSTPKPRPE